MKRFKICPCCKESKKVSCFSKDKNTKDGLDVYCKICKYEKVKKYKDSPKGKEQNRISSRDYRKRHPEMVKESNKKGSLKYFFGSEAVEIFNKLFEQQKGCCAICGRHQSELNNRLSLDHDHDRSDFRGLLCKRCNTLAGSSKSHIGLLEKVIEYLETFYEGDR